ncbi:MAG: DUF1819 family protein [Acidobacteriaceae bacterium]|nr:DUF1819 family protein [Acidobacteriaceae bacterium]
MSPGPNGLDSRTAPSVPYTSRIIKAGALIGDTKTLLSHWDLNASVEDNLNRARQENFFGKASRSRVEDILAIFRQRYLTEAPVTKALVTLVLRKFPSACLERVFFFHAARADKLLHDVVTEVLVPMEEQGHVHITVADLNRALTNWAEQGKTTSRWSESTVTHAVRGLMSTLRDFGVLQGAVNKKIAPSYVPIEAFAYVMFYLKQHQSSGSKLIELPDWKLFFLRREVVERFLFEAHQRDLLEYHVAGSVTRLTFPATSIEEYANVLVER